MKMETNEDSCDSLPYIDDVPTADEDTPPLYNLKITENYRNKNRDIKISNRSPNEIPPEGNETRREMRAFPSSGMKLVIKGCNSSVSIQGLDNQSSITFKRRCEKAQKEVGVEESTAKANADEGRPKRRKWKMLTKSLMLSRSVRSERRGMDERYPKYVLLKNEDDEVNNVKENYPKMFVFNERRQKGKSAFKPDFNLKKSFKNKTEPIVPLEEILTKTEERRNRKSSEMVKSKQKQPLTARCRNENKNNSAAERRKSLKPDAGCPPPANFVSGEIQGIFEHALKLLPASLDVQQRDESRPSRNDPECSAAIPPQFYHFPCQDQFCCLGAPDQAPKYIPVSCPPQYVGETPNAQTCQRPAEEARDADVENLPFGFLSNFFPRVIVMNAIRSEDLTTEERKERVVSNSAYEVKDSEKEDEGSRGSEVVQLPPKAVPEDSCLSDVSMKESSDEELKTKTQESETTTEYFHYDEFTESTGNEAAERKNCSSPPPRYDSKESTSKTFSPVKAYESQRGEENLQNLSLTKVGYKMYDRLTKLSLNREKDGAMRSEMSGCGCNGNEAKKSPCNITFESSSSVVKVTMPEKELNLQIVNSLGADIQIGVKSGVGGSSKREEKEEKRKIQRFERAEDEGKEMFQKEDEEEKKIIVRKEELWHPDGGGGTVALQSKGTSQADVADTAFQKVKVSLADDRAVVLSIKMAEGDEKRDKTKEKRTKEIKVGTDDFDLAGGDFQRSSGGSQQNLSPRIGRLLKHLHDKLESDERQRKFLDEKINEKLLREEGMFLVKHISPGREVAKTPREVPVWAKAKKEEERSGQPREYYCEECLATLRMFEDRNPSVKSMVDKFETIIQLESY